MTALFKILTILILLTFLLAGCGGSGGSDDTTAPATGDGTTPPGDGTTPPGDGTTPPGDGTTPPGDGTTPPGDGTTPPGDGTTPPGDGTTPPGDGTTPPGDGTTPPINGGGGNGGGTPPTDNIAAGAVGIALDQFSATGSTNDIPVNFSVALDVNQVKEIIGYVEIEPGDAFVASLWTVSATGTATVTPQELQPLGISAYSAALALDDFATAVGQSADGARLVAVYWKDGQPTPTRFPELHTSGNYKAHAISDDGSLAVGEAVDASGRTRAVVWAADNDRSFNSAPVVLPTTVFSSGPDLSPFSSANGVARVGTSNEILIVGEAEAGNGTIHAALWRSTNDGVNFTSINLGANHIAYAVNGARQVVGENDNTLAPVSWTVSATGVASAPLSLAGSGSAVAINNNGRTAGWTGASPRATVWTGTTPTPLSSTESWAYGMNDDDQPLVVGREGGQGFIKRVD